MACHLRVRASTHVTIRSRVRMPNQVMIRNLVRTRNLVRPRNRGRTRNRVRMPTSSTAPTRSAPPTHPTETGCGRFPWRGPAVRSIRSAWSIRSARSSACARASAQPANAPATQERDHPNLRYACRTKDRSPTGFNPDASSSPGSSTVHFIKSGVFKLHQSRVTQPLASGPGRSHPDTSSRPGPASARQPAFFLNFDSSGDSRLARARFISARPVSACANWRNISDVL